MEFTREIQDALSAPFPEDEIEFLPRAHSNGKALGLAYIDARDVMRRLDAVVGAGNWSFDFDVLSPDGKMVRGKLTVCGITKCDAGEANTEDELLKSAVSDALKRAAVHFGIGRYLYYLPRVWAPYDNQKRTWAEPPRLNPAAVERALATCGVTHNRSTPAPRPSVVNGGLNGGNGTHREATASRPPLRETAKEASIKETSVKEAPVKEAPVTEARPAPAAPATAPSRMADAEANKKSPWSSGAGRAEGGRPETTPESSGDRAASRNASAASSASGSASPGAAWNGTRDIATLQCSTETCGKPLTKGQHDMSVRAFGDPLCPACQKERARTAA